MSRAPSTPSRPIPARDADAEFATLDRGAQIAGALGAMGLGLEGRRVLDLGAGYGFLSLAAARAGAASVVAVDADAGRLATIEERAAAAGLPVATVQANLLAGELPVPPADLAFLIGVVEYAGLWSARERPRDLQVRVFRAAHAALEEGGALVFGSKSRLWPSQLARDIHTRQTLVHALPRGAADRLSRRRTGEPFRHHLHTPAGWRSMLREAGFREVELYVPYFSYQFPLLVQRTATFGAIRRIRSLPLSAEERAAAVGPRWLPKALLMAAGAAVRVPLAHSVLFKAVK